MSKMKTIAIPMLSLLFLLTVGGCDKVSSSSSDSSISLSSSKKLIVTFDTAGGTQVEPQQLDPGDVVTEPTGVEKDGYVIDGWFSDGEEWDFDTPVYEDMTLVANWVSDTSVVNFLLDGGSMPVTSETYRYGESVVLPIPTKEGYVFTGWYYGDEPVHDGPWSIHGDVTLLATWAKEKISLSYFDGEEQVGNQVVEYGKPFVLLDYSSMGVGVRGWLLGDVVIPLLGESWDYSIDDAILTPAWADKTYSLSVLGMDEDEYTCPTSFDIQVGKENRLPVPVADAHIDCGPFVGWFLDGKRVSDENGLVPADWFPESDENVLDGVFGTPIETAEEFDAIRKNLDGFYFLTSDIDLGGAEWTPIGTIEEPFSGCLVGFGHEISNFKITQSTSYAALFAYCESATFHDFTISEGVLSLDAPLGEDMYCAALCAVAQHTLFSRIISAESNVIDVNLRGGTGYVAGISAENYYANFDNCINLSDVSLPSSSSASGYACGIGQGDSHDNVTFSNCVNYGTVTSTSTSRAYAFGIGNGSTFSNCVNYGYIDISFTSYNSSHASGIGDGLTFVNCVNYGDMTSTSSSPSIYYGYGIGEGSTFVNCVNYGDITPTSSKYDSDYYGYGIGEGSTFVNCVNYGGITITSSSSLSDPDYYGYGIGDGSTFVNCVNYGYIDISFTSFNDSHASGIGDGSTFSNCANYGTVSVTEPASSGNYTLGIGLGFKFSYCINIGNLTGANVGLCSPVDSLVSLSSVLSCCTMRGMHESGALVLGEVSDYDCVDSYYSNFVLGSGQTVNTDIGSSVSPQDLDGEFMKDQMSFDSELWNLDGVDFEARSFPPSRESHSMTWNS